MGLFDVFKKKSSAHKGFHSLKVNKISRLTENAVAVEFEIPTELKSAFTFKAGQYIDVIVPLNGHEERRSYSICSAPGEPISIGVKAVENGKVSNWFVSNLAIGDDVLVGEPKGQFGLHANEKKVVAIAAGSGITPILSIAKSLQKDGGHMTLFYGNKTLQSTMFSEELTSSSSLTVHHYLSLEERDGCAKGRITNESFTEAIKTNLELLKADAFLLCGPEEMIMTVSSVLEFYGVATDKIRYELFTTPVHMKSGAGTETKSSFDGESKVTLILDSEISTITVPSNGATILEVAEKAGLDVPFSCRGGVCCSCRAKVKKGTVRMEHNFSLTDKDIENGYVLSCQAHPTSDELILSFDE